MLRAVASSPLFAEGEVVQRRVLGKQLAFATLKCDDRSGLLEVLLTLSRLARADRETPTACAQSLPCCFPERRSLPCTRS
jgi:hypothetical protein